MAIIGTRTGTPISRLEIDQAISRFFVIHDPTSPRFSEFSGLVYQRAQMAHLTSGTDAIAGILNDMRTVAEHYGLTQRPDAAKLAAYQRANQHDSVSAVFEHGNSLYRGGGLLGLAALSANNPRGYGALREAGGGLGSYADIGRITMTNYIGSPFSATGMNYTTFTSLRAQGFHASHILHAGQDTRQHGFSPNGPMARSFAILDREDGARRAERNQHLERLKRIAEQDEQLKKLKREYESARTPEDRARILSQIDARGRELQGGSGYAGFVQQAPTEAGRAEGRKVGAAVVRRAALGYEVSPGAQLNNNPADLTASLAGTERREVVTRGQEITVGESRTAQSIAVERSTLTSERADLLADTPPAPRGPVKVAEGSAEVPAQPKPEGGAQVALAPAPGPAAGQTGSPPAPRAGAPQVKPT